ncbi:MAG: type II secretion system F family protein [Armatimonadetes bacterium]|nr:type II secretion system F family protein [Armatimonadota bacterium]NIO74859.1 type II secretion system F family protein [Armatimonadota bacterium]NIO95621.1 type II secretion system F family protein [Armatimonadota bacterium]
MPTYRYTAMDPAGKVIAGRLEADSLELVRGRLAELRYHILNLRESGAAGGEIAGLLGRFQRVKLRDLVMFSRQFATMIDAGLSVVKCLDILQQQCRNPKLAEVVGAVKHDVAGGASLTDALAKHPRVFSSLYINMVRSAETGGILDQVLDRLATFLEKEQEVRGKIKSAMTYPAVVLFFSVLMLMGLIFFVLPKFKVIFETMNLKLPTATRVLLGISDVGRQYWFVVLAVMVGLFIVYRLYARTPRGALAIDWMKLRMPVFGDLVMKSSVSRFARTFGTLITSGVPVLRALDIVADTSGNRVLSDTIGRARASIKEGEKISAPLFSSRVFPVMVTQMIAVGEETGRLDQMLLKVSDFYDKEVDATLKSLTSLIEPVMIVGLGCIVALIAISVISPIYELVGSIG